MAAQGRAVATAAESLGEEGTSSLGEQGTERLVPRKANLIVSAGWEVPSRNHSGNVPRCWCPLPASLRLLLSPSSSPLPVRGTRGGEGSGAALLALQSCSPRLCRVCRELRSLRCAWAWLVVGGWLKEKASCL